MKKIIIPVITCFFIFSISSCKKCQTCSNDLLGNTVSTEVCQDDFDSKEEYDLWIESYEASGGNCQ